MDGETTALLEEALMKALEYEGRVKGVYQSALEEARDPIGRQVSEVLAKEEQGHIDYLERKLEELRKSGEITSGGLETVLPSRSTIESGVKSLKRKLESGDRLETEADLLRKALAVEEETSSFYKKMAEELPREGRDFFVPFQTIEEGHVAIVQAELDAVTNMGFWFDYREFDLEAG
jgi:rubrerythrin